MIQQGTKHYKIEQGEGQTFVFSVTEDAKALLKDSDGLLSSPVVLQQEDSQDASSSDSTTPKVFINCQYKSQH